MMDLDQLQSVRDRERQTDKLQQLRESFYADAAELVADLREERDRAAAEAEDPFDDPRVSRLSDQISTAEQTVEAIYEKRVGKLVKAASFAAADLPAETEGMTAEEQDLFDALVADIRANRQRVLDVLAGEGDESAPGTADADDAGSPAGVDAASMMGGEDGPPPAPPAPNEDDEGTTSVTGATSSPDDESPGEESSREATPGTDQAGDTASDGPEEGVSTDGVPADSGDEGPTAASGSGPDTGSDDRAGRDRTRGSDGSGGQGSTVERHELAGPDSRESESPTADAIERTTVRITTDVGEVFGVDERSYHLEADQVVTLPTANAEPLLEQDAAERID